MANTIKVKINGAEITTAAGKTILDVARENGVEIPTLCYDPRLPAVGSCLLCVVEVEGFAKLVLSCTTEAREGMVITTDNERVYKARKDALDMLMSNHFADCRGPCYEKCPIDVDVQGYLALAHAGRHYEALELIRSTNPFPLVCGRVCVRYCEAACRRREVDESAVGINFVKRYVSDLENDNLPKPAVPPSNGHKVAIVGGGPAGLTAAYFLARAGYKVKVFDAQPKLGGMLRYGIPDYRLPQETLDKEIQYITDHGVDVETNKRLGKDFSLDDLKAQGFEAIYLALGAQKAKPMRIKNEDTPGVVGGVDFLGEVKKAAAPPELKGTVVVVGGGNTAIDAARTALRCNAAKVQVLYRRTAEEMPADPEEVQDALDEGVEIKYLVAPMEVVRGENGSLKALRCQKMTLGEPDASGRRRPVPLEGSEEDVPCNMIIAAIGQDVDLTGLRGNAMGDVKSTKWETIIVEKDAYATNVPGVFAGGDAESGPMAAADAIGAGRKAAYTIDKYIQTGKLVPAYKEFLSKKTNLSELPADFFAKYEKTHRSHTVKDDPATRISTWTELDHGVTAESAKHETERCLSCGCSAVFTCDLKRYAGEYAADQKRFSGKVKKYKVDDRHPYITLDPNKCILCGKCVRLCADLQMVSALGFINRGYDMIVRPSMEKPLQNTTCISCGNCIEVCPTGAIDFALDVKKPGPWRTTESESLCGYCGVGCRLVFNKKNDDVWYVTAKKESRFVNGELCMRGRFGNRYILTDMRLREPHIIEGGKRIPTNMAAAQKKLVEGLKAVADKHGAGSVAFFISPKASNEEVMLVERLARGVFKTNNIASLYDTARNDEDRDLYAGFGLTASTLSRRQLERADVIVVINSDVTRENPVLGFSIKRAAKRGAALVCVSSTESELTAHSALRLDGKRGTNATLLSAAANYIIKNNLLDRAFIDARTEGYEEFAKTVNVSADKAEKATGVEKEKIEKFANLIADPAKSVVFVYNIDSALERSGGDLQMIANILLLTGKIGKENNGIMFAHEHSNYQGHKDLSAHADAVSQSPRFKGASFSGARSLMELRQMIAERKIKGLFIFGEDFAINREYAELMGQAEFVGVVDMFETETTRAANVAIPGSAYFEQEGSATSAERRVTAFKRVFEPPAGKTGFEVLSGVYALAAGRAEPTLEDARAMIAEANPYYAPIKTIGETGSFLWSDGGDGNGGELLFAKEFARENGKAKFVAVSDAAKQFDRRPACFSTIDRLFDAQWKRMLAGRRA